MAVYSIDISSDQNEITSIKNALNTAGILTTTHYETSNRLIVTTNRSNKVIRIVLDAKFPRIYIGDSWSSGDAVNNQVTINEFADCSGCAEVNVIVTDVVLCIGARHANSTVTDTIFTKLNDTAQEYVALGIVCNSTSGTPILRDLTNNAQIHCGQLTATIISADGYYYNSDFPCMTAGGVLMATAIQGIKSLQMPSTISSHYVRYGGDVVIPGGATNSMVSYFPRSILITNGYSWAPA